ncbi:MAG: glycogen/starch synthase [Paludibacteraceae bacterium]|nr:glycogen/starch synthase [Paludibacteraceae bacterium]MBR1786952.1 glycogen/starch synthase [Paludibacteraceae bacterium]MBR1808064.1 glycogen/starch synthase [Paludibacteraceae bacterium]
MKGGRKTIKQTGRILFITQEIAPFLEANNPVRLLNRDIPEACQLNGWETRIFMPKFGEISERRHQLHDVIRLSGMNIIINEMDHPLLLKVASVQGAHIQVYFVDNDDYFHGRKGVQNEKGIDYEDNDERCIFFARSALETILKLRWKPDAIICSGWMSALAPMYIRRAFADSPFLNQTKIIYSLYNQSFNRKFPSSFSEKLKIPGVHNPDITCLLNKNAEYLDLIRLGVQYSDALILSENEINPKLQKIILQSDIPTLQYAGDTPEKYIEFIGNYMPPKPAN